MTNVKLLHGDCLEVMRAMPDESVDAVVTDPPYGLSFMGKRWDYDVPSVEIWQECLRVLRPGGHLLAFAGTRTQHRMCVRIEDAGFEIRDMIAWVYGSGFPKSLDVSKAIDKAAGLLAHEGKNMRVDGGTGTASYRPTIDPRDYVPPAPATDAARQWQGWGTALKPALEPITVARKPLVGTVANNVLRYGTGAINVDGCRVGDSTGRWPANLIHDGSDEVTGLFPGNEGRFFYCAKASKRDRDEGLSSPEVSPGQKTGREEGSAGITPYAGSRAPTRNNHPTVKPTALMRYLCRLVTPPKGVVLDPFMGSGSTGKAAALEGFAFIGIEREESYLEIARARIDSAAR